MSDRKKELKQLKEIRNDCARIINDDRYSIEDRTIAFSKHIEATFNFNCFKFFWMIRLEYILKLPELKDKKVRENT